MKDYIKSIIIHIIFISSIYGCRTNDGYYLINHCYEGATMKGCREWRHESDMTEQEKWNAMSIPERMIYSAKKEKSNKDYNNNEKNLEEQDNITLSDEYLLADDNDKIKKRANKSYKQLQKQKDKLLEERRKREKLEKELEILKKKTEKKKNNISSDTELPQIIITYSDVQNKKGTIEGKVYDNIEVAELIINDVEVNFDKKGKFKFSTFIPKNGKKLILQVTDSKGLSKKKIITLQRKKILSEKKLFFSSLNPIKMKGKNKQNAFALVVGINNYLRVSDAIYADNDALLFADYANNIIGIPQKNIKTLSNEKASEIELKIALKSWLKGYSTPEESDIYIFFAGHGLASTDGKELYLLPYDGEPRLLEDTALLRSEIFDTVKSINPKSVTVFLDACYSGQTREKDIILADARPIAIAPVESAVPENFTVFSASSGSEISGSLPEADHGLFSYFLMKGLEGDADANNDKKITNGELHNYVRFNVTRQALRLGREQTPQLQGDENKVLVEFD